MGYDRPVCRQAGGSQSLIYTIAEDGTKIRRGEITEMSLDVGRSVETINSQGQNSAGKKPGLPEATGTMTYRIGQEQDQWGRLVLGPPRTNGGRVRPERFTILATLFDREVPHASKRVLKLHNCWVSNATIPITAVDEAVLTGTATIQVEWVEYLDHFNPLPPGQQIGATPPLVLGR
ncbi:MAG: hypothetical protein FWG64_01535 [Firmicutes bacterium]|nr:hypothetical protein [Bacillota bacterium]